MDDQTVRPLRLLLADVWKHFHRVWGLNSEGLYDKREWAELQQCLHELLFRLRIERRRRARPGEQHD